MVWSRSKRIPDTQQPKGDGFPELRWNVKVEIRILVDGSIEKLECLRTRYQRSCTRLKGTEWQDLVVSEKPEEEPVDVEGEAKVASYSLVRRFTCPRKKTEGLGGAVIKDLCMEEIVGDNVVKKLLSKEAKWIPVEEIDILDVIEYG